MRRGGELVAVRQALELAYPEGGHKSATSAVCQAILVCRTPGTLAIMPAYAELSGQHAMSEGDVKAIVRHGRRRVGEELAERGLIPAPRVMARRTESVSSVRRAEEVADV
jgi:hypothetical protein